ncbi:MAG: ribosome maturation factor RimM [Chitinophagaceae bacterium]
MNLQSNPDGLAYRDFAYKDLSVKTLFMSKYQSIGKIVAAHGLNGEVVMAHNLGKKTNFKGLHAFFVEDRNKEMLPYFLESVKIKNDQESYCKIEGINTREAVKLLLRREIWLLQDDFARFVDSSSPLALLGFNLIDEGQDLGEILEVIEQPNQILCRIDLKGKEALIPLHQETLVKVDKKAKRVHVSLPHGLLEIFS